MDKTSDNAITPRVLGYMAARELTIEELSMVSGGASSNSPSWSGAPGHAVQDDVATDEF